MKRKVDEINQRSHKSLETNSFDKNLKAFNAIILGHDFK